MQVRSRSLLSAVALSCAFAMCAPAQGIGSRAARALAKPRHFDLLVRGGRIADGTGAPLRGLDVAVQDGRIAALGDLGDATADRVVDASGLILCPGFIDGHAHADQAALREPTALNFVAMGVTTLVTGNCGGSADDVGAHLAAVETRGIAVNYATLIGHGTVRTAVLGNAERAPRDTELAHMRTLVRNAMDAGAYGLSSGLIYVPGTFAKTDEIVALCEEVAAAGGVYATHMRDEGSHLLDSVREALTIGARAGVPVHLSHLKASGKPNWGMSAALVACLDEARARGVRVTGDQYAYTASSTSLDVLFPSSALSIGRRAFCERLRDDPAFADAMRDALLAGMARDGFGDLSYAQVAGAAGSPQHNGRRIAEIALLDRGDDSPRTQAEVAISLMVESHGARVGMVYHKMCEPDVERIMRLPYVAIASDAGIRTRVTVERPHPRGAGNNPRVLGLYARERHVLGLPLAIHKMTGLPAAIFGIIGRGTLAIGAAADLVLFDPDTIADGATYAEPTTRPRGIAAVFVNGIAVVADGEPTGALPGQVLRHTSRPTR